MPYATFSDPQSLDLYNYTLGNPETNADPNGHRCLLGLLGTTCAHPPSKSWANGNPPFTAHPNLDCLDQHCRSAMIPAGAMAGDAAATWWEVGGSSLGSLALDTATGGVALVLELTLGQTGGDPALLYKQRQATKGKKAPKRAKGFKNPTNPPQYPPDEVPPGWRVRVMPPTAEYPDGYWRLEKPLPNGGWQGIDPSTMRPGTQPETHVPLPPGVWGGV